MRAPSLLAFGAAALLGCAAAPTTPSFVAAPVGSLAAQISKVEAPEPPAATAAADPAPSPPAEAPRRAAPEPPFPPPAFAPPLARTARPGDGVWSPMAGPGAELLYRTTVHPDAIKPQVAVAVVAIDLRGVDLRLVAGTLEPLSATVPDAHRPGVIPGADLPGLLAVFNGGFMTRHGAWGMMIAGEVFLPAREDGCTVALYRDGAVRVRTLPALGGAAADLLAYRQTPPCLVEQGAVQEALLGGDKPRRWGLSETGGVDIRRSALGLAEGGRTLLYGLGEWITPRALAEAMRAAGAVDAAQLDVNWSFTRFLLYGKPASPSSPPEVAETLIPKLKHAHRQYVIKPSERDFFYLARKAQPSKSSAR